MVILATVNKDFKVKNGIIVNGGGTFGDAVVVGTPTLSNHAVTKEYVDSLTGGMPVGPTPPSSPTDGQLWLDTLTSRVNVYKDGSWITLAAIDDTLNIPQHIHDTAIDGTGFVVSRFYDAGFYNSAQATSASGGFYNTASWVEVWDGGSAVDNFN